MFDDDPFKDRPANWRLLAGPGLLIVAGYTLFSASQKGGIIWTGGFLVGAWWLVTGLIYEVRVRIAMRKYWRSVDALQSLERKYVREQAIAKEKTRSLPRDVVRELVRVASADGEVSTVEVELIHEMALRLFPGEVTNNDVWEEIRAGEVGIIDEMGGAIKFLATSEPNGKFVVALFTMCLHVALMDGPLKLGEQKVLMSIANELWMSKELRTSLFEEVRESYRKARAEQRESSDDTEVQRNKARARLGVGRSASRAEIKAAYHKLALKYHPDRLAGQARAVQEEAAKQFIQIRDAYQLLCQ